MPYRRMRHRIIISLFAALAAINCSSSDNSSGSSGGSAGSTSTGDTTPPVVSSTTPTDTSTNIAITTTISVTFGEAMQVASISAPTSTTCGSSTLQVSSNNFTSCIAMTSATPTASGSNTVFTMTPAASLANGTTYKIRVTTSAKDAAGNALASQYTSGTGFTTVAAGDVTPPTVSSTTPTNASTGSALSATIAVTFNEAMTTGTVTATTSTTCGSASLQVSSDNFATCVAMTSATPTASGGNTIFTMTPAANLASNTTYKIRVTTGVKDASANALAAQFTTATGFTTLYSRTITIDGTNDFNVTENELSTSNTGKVYVSYDATNVYVGMTHGDILGSGTGSGNKFIYVIFNSDATLATGNANSSDSKAKFGTTSKKMQYHWKERVDGANFTEFQSAPAGTWAAWTSSGSTNRASGYVEASIPRTSFGSPSKLQITFYLVDYNGGSGNGWLYNMLNGATEGAAATPVDLVKYVEIDFAASANPNAAGNIKSF